SKVGFSYCLAYYLRSLRQGRVSLAEQFLNRLPGELQCVKKLESLDRNVFGRNHRHLKIGLQSKSGDACVLDELNIEEKVLHKKGGTQMNYVYAFQTVKSLLVVVESDNWAGSFG